MTNENTIRWSGLAAAIGGTLWLLPWTGWLGDLDDSSGFLMALAGLVLVGFGLLGLFRRLAVGGSSRRKTLFFGLALGGVLLIMASALSGLLTGISRFFPFEMPILAVLLAAGVVFMIIGLAGMGLIAISERALGRLSFAPFLLAISLLGIIVTISLTIADPLVDLFEIVTIGCWLLFGVALWTAREPEADPAPAS